MMAEKSHLIDGAWVQGSGEEIVSVNPASGERTWSGHRASSDEVALAVTAARKAFDRWVEVPLDERVEYLEVFATQLAARKEEVANSICRDTGKPHWEALTEIAAMRGKIDFSIQAYRERCRTMERNLAGAQSTIRYKPHGVVVVFGPFNLPGHLPNAHIVPALLAGNTVVFKPSGQAQLVAETLMKLWEAAGLPPGVLNMVQCGRDTGMGLVTDPGVDGIFFTGSLEAGKAIHRALAENPGRIVALEMGGNNPLVVHQVGNLRAAAYLTVQSAFITAGQRCTCARRLIVPQGGEGDEFVATLAALIEKIRVGSYKEVPEPFMGPVISVNAAEGLTAAYEDLLSNGGNAVAPMKRLDRSGAFLSPGLIDVTEAQGRTDAELFGPILQLVRVPDFDAAVAEANNTAFGLSAGLLSDRKDLYDRFYRGIRAGIVNWNRQITGASGTMPFGGIKDSGNHRPSGYYAADYCSYPIASIEADRVALPESLAPGIEW